MELDALWDFNDPAASEEKFALWLMEQPAGTQLQAEGLTQLARAQGLQGHFDQAHETLNDADLITGEHRTRARVRVLLERGRVYNSSDDKAAALDLFKQAVTLASEINEDGLEVDAMHMVAIADDPELSADHNRAAIRRAEESGDPAARKWLGSLFNNLGWSLFEEKKTEEALRCFQSALKYREEQGSRIAEAKWPVARALRELGRNDEALAMQLSLQDGNDGFVEEELALLYRGKGDLAKAKTHAEKAVALLGAKPWYVKNEPHRLQTMKDIAG